jgi:hypothetical protein
VTALSDADRRLIAEARELAALQGADAIRERAGDPEILGAIAFMFGEAQAMLRELARVAERPGRIEGNAAAAAADTPHPGDIRRRITEARELAGLVTASAVIARFPRWGNDWNGALLPAYVEAFTTARYALDGLAALAERLDGIRALLARFDWEHDDRQLALEAIERIADGDEDQDDEDDEPETYCRTCGADVGIFIGHGGAWLHYTGEGTTASPVELYDAGHAPDVAWRPAGGQ